MCCSDGLVPPGGSFPHSLVDFHAALRHARCSKHPLLGLNRGRNLPVAAGLHLETLCSPLSHTDLSRLLFPTAHVFLFLNNLLCFAVPFQRLLYCHCFICLNKLEMERGRGAFKVNRLRCDCCNSASVSVCFGMLHLRVCLAAFVTSPTSCKAPSEEFL